MLAEVGKKHPSFTDYHVVRRLTVDPTTETMCTGIDDSLVLYRDGVYFVTSRHRKSKLYSRPLSIDGIDAILPAR